MRERNKITCHTEGPKKNNDAAQRRGGGQKICATQSREQKTFCDVEEAKKVIPAMQRGLRRIQTAMDEREPALV